MTDGYHRVGLAEARVSTDGEALTTSGLGSCLAVAAYTPDGTGGLLHAMVPTAPEEGDDGRPAKFVDTGLDWLLDRVEAAGHGRVRAKLAGGAAMFSFGHGGRPVGDRNVAVATDVLAARGVPVTGTDLGGSVGRFVQFDPGEATMLVRRADGTSSVH